MNPNELVAARREHQIELVVVIVRHGQIILEITKAVGVHEVLLGRTFQFTFHALTSSCIGNRHRCWLFEVSLWCSYRIITAIPSPAFTFLQL